MFVFGGGGGGGPQRGGRGGHGERRGGHGGHFGRQFGSVATGVNASGLGAASSHGTKRQRAPDEGYATPRWSTPPQQQPQLPVGLAIGRGEGKS